MTYSEYTAIFNQILTAETPSAPYDDPDYLNYTKLNESRSRRWIKQGELREETVAQFKALNQKQHWIIIAEPWCGDAAHIVPFVVKMAELNPLISYDIQLRDSAPFLIEDYLTDGSKSIPKLIVRDSNGNDLFIWGPRPKKTQEMFLKAKETSTDITALKVALQEWYNEDKGVEIQKEITQLLAKTIR